ncbi:hypothetical protein IGI39_003282 [Enterococcus sp. AZ135]
MKITGDITDFSSVFLELFQTDSDLEKKCKELFK